MGERLVKGVGDTLVRCDGVGEDRGGAIELAATVGGLADVDADDRGPAAIANLFEELQGAPGDLLGEVVVALGEGHIAEAHLRHCLARLVADAAGQPRAIPGRR